MGSFRDLLVEISRDPAMIFFLDNCLSHKGRHQRELRSASCWSSSPWVWAWTASSITRRTTSRNVPARFTGWTVANNIPGQPYGRYSAKFVYNPDDHDDGAKTFLGETGNFNGEDVIDIIASRPATARFISRHLYSYFVADEAQVPAWMETPPRDMDTIKMLEDEYFRSGYDIRSMLRVLFHSDAFKNARFQRVKSPIETVIGTLRLVGDWTEPKPGFEFIFDEMKHMGQEIFNPPSVEGWHTGREWIDGGTLVHRINFTAEFVGDVKQPGVKEIIDRLADQGPVISPETMVDATARLMGHYETGARDSRDAGCQPRQGWGPCTPTPQSSRAVSANFSR